MNSIYGILFIVLGVFLLKFKRRQTQWDVNKAEAGRRTFEDIPLIARFFVFTKSFNKKYTPFSMTLLGVGFIISGFLVILLTILQ